MVFIFNVFPLKIVAMKLLLSGCWLNIRNKVALKNTLKVWGFTKNKLRHGCFGINLQKVSLTNILEDCTGQMLLIVALIVS